MSESLNLNAVREGPLKVSSNFKVKRVVIVDEYDNHYVILSNNIFLSDCFLLKIEDPPRDDSIYENDIIIKIGYNVSDVNNKQVAGNIYNNIISPLHEKELIFREDNKRERYSEIHIGVKEYILTGKTCPNKYEGEYKIICNGLTNNDDSLINAIVPMMKSNYDHLFVNQINILDNRISYGDDLNEYNIINYVYGYNVKCEGRPYARHSLTIFNSEFYYNEGDILFNNVDGLILNSSFKNSTIKNLSMTIKDMKINYSELYCDAEMYRHRLRNLLEVNTICYYTGKEKYQISLFNTKLSIYSDSQDPDGNGLEPDEEGYIFIDIPNVINVSNGYASIDAGSANAYSTVRTNPEVYNVNLSGMSGIDDYPCFICLEPSKDHTVKYLGFISLFDIDMKLNGYDMYIFNRDIHKIIFIKYGNTQLPIDSLLSYFEKTNKKLYNLNKDIILGYSNTILLNRI